MKWTLAVVTFAMLAMLSPGRAVADPKVPPELANVQPPIEPKYLTSLTFLGKHKLGTREVVAWQQTSENDTNQCCDVPPGNVTFLYVADATTGERIMEEIIGDMVGDKDYIESEYRYRVSWTDLDGDKTPELVLTRSVLRGDLKPQDFPREHIWKFRFDKLTPVSRAQLRCRPRTTTKEAADAALLAASPGDAFCAYAEARLARGESLEAAQIVLPVPDLCPTFAWWQRNDPEWLGEATPVTVYVLRDGAVYSTSVAGTDLEAYKADGVRVIDLKLVPNGDRPFLVLETVAAGKHHAVVIDATQRSTELPPIVDEPLSPGERITVHDLTIAVGPAKGAARKHWTYDPAADAWQ